MKQSIPRIFYGLGGILIITAVAVLLILTSHASAEPQLQSGLPVYGWSVCQDLGLAPPPGGGIEVQHMALCTGSGWRVHSYCIEPNKPAPALNTICSMVNATDFWCGDPVQSFRLLSVLQTPPPAPTRTSTSTSTFTPTVTQTFTPTQTGTPVPSQTSRPSSTPGAAATSSQDTPQPQPTVYNRPHPGGTGSLQLVASILAVFSGAVLVGISVLVRIRKTGSNTRRK